MEETGRSDDFVRGRRIISRRSARGLRAPQHELLSVRFLAVHTSAVSVQGACESFEVLVHHLGTQDGEGAARGEESQTTGPISVQILCLAGVARFRGHSEICRVWLL